MFHRNILLGYEKNLICQSFFLFTISSGNREAFSRSDGVTSRASAISKRVSREKLFAVFGASIILSSERLISAFSAKASCDIPRSLRREAIAIPSCMKRSRFLKATSFLVGFILLTAIPLLYFF